MDTSVITVSMAETEFDLRLHYKRTEAYFEEFKIEHAARDRVIISVSEKEIEEYKTQDECSDHFAEYCQLRLPMGNLFTHRDRIIFHGVSFIYEKGAYILTAPSGTGKSTQFRNLRHLFGDKYRIISGDKPILSIDNRGEIHVWPSPWNGKERWAGCEHAPLKGIFILSQGKENSISRAEGADTVLRLMEEVLFSAPDLKSVKTACRFIDVMMKEIPLYYFVNRGDYASSGMLDQLICELEKKHEIQSAP